MTRLRSLRSATVVGERTRSAVVITSDQIAIHSTETGHPPHDIANSCQHSVLQRTLTLYPEAKYLASRSILKDRAGESCLLFL
jgi:hypothetical protein